MKTQLSIKIVAFTIVLTIFAIKTKAQVKPHAEGPPHGGYICNCNVVGYGCRGIAACYNHCYIACPHKSSSSLSVYASVSLNNYFTCQTNTSVVLITKDEMQKKIQQLEWGVNQISDNSAIKLPSGEKSINQIETSNF